MDHGPALQDAEAAAAELDAGGSLLKAMAGSMERGGGCGVRACQLGSSQLANAARGTVPCGGVARPCSPEVVDLEGFPPHHSLDSRLMLASSPRADSGDGTRFNRAQGLWAVDAHPPSRSRRTVSAAPTAPLPTLRQRMATSSAPPVSAVAAELATLTVGATANALTPLDRAVEDHLSRVDDISAQLDAVRERPTAARGAPASAG